MYQRYDDILSRIGEEPAWFDEHAVPRYCTFAPNKIANIYSGETALAEVTCQCCKRIFRVAFSEINWNAERIAVCRPLNPGVPEVHWKSARISDAIRSRTLHFGDPPNVCCHAGATMNSEPRRVIEYWHRKDPQYTQRKGNVTLITDMAYHTWTRDSSFEVDIRPDWVTP